VLFRYLVTADLVNYKRDYFSMMLKTLSNSAHIAPGVQRVRESELGRISIYSWCMATVKVKVRVGLGSALKLGKVGI